MVLAADAPALESLETLLAWYGVLGNEWEAFYRNLFGEKFPFAPRKVARRITDGEELRFGDTRAVAVVAPATRPGTCASISQTTGSCSSATTT